MKSKIIYTVIIVAVSLSLAIPAFAAVQTGRNGFEAQGQQQRIQNNQNRGDNQVTSRVNDLGNLLMRIQDMKNLSDSQKAAFASTIQAQIASLNELLNKIKNDTSTTSLRTDLKSIAPDFRIYMLVMPQLSLMSAVDRVNAIVTTLKATAAKLQIRVSGNATSSGNATIASDLLDLNAKLTDAAAQAASAQAEVTGLKPDNGDKTVMQSNTAALKDARTKIQAAQKDLEAARKDAKAVIQIIMQSSRKDRRANNGSSTPDR